MVVTLVIVVLVSINTLYVAAEFSAVSVRRSRLEELARSGNHAARLLTTVIRNPAALDRDVEACQIGITLSSLEEKVSRVGEAPDNRSHEALPKKSMRSIAFRRSLKTSTRRRTAGDPEGRDRMWIFETRPGLLAELWPLTFLRGHAYAQACHSYPRPLPWVRTRR